MLSIFCSTKNCANSGCLAADADLAAFGSINSDHLRNHFCDGWISLVQNFSFQRVAPNSAPTPAVSAIASAPQKVTRATDFQMGEPPARAAREPNSARKNNEL